MTTPQLHVLQFKRSKGVKHYCHIIHALSHIDTYEIFALDYFDSVLLNSALPIPFIREVERVRGLKAKSLYITGCTYADVLQAKLETYHKLPHSQKIYFFEGVESSSNSTEVDSKLDSKANSESTPSVIASLSNKANQSTELVPKTSKSKPSEKPHNNSQHNSSALRLQNDKLTESKPHTILLAPSWGRESLLSKYGMRLITPFIDSNFYLIIRPHPQSFVSESSLITSLQEQTKHCKNIAWDTNKDNIYAMYCADLMIGDFSGVMFDFACLFEKPLLAPELEFNIIGYDLEDICEQPWVKDALPRLGMIFSPNEIDNIKALATSLLSDTKMQANLRANIASLKDELWAYRSRGGEMSALALLEIQKDILESKLGDNLTLHTQINTLQGLLDSNDCGLSGDLESQKTNNEDSKLDSKTSTYQFKHCKESHLDSQGVDYHAGKPTRNDEKTESNPHANIESKADSERTSAVGHSSTAIESMDAVSETSRELYSRQLSGAENRKKGGSSASADLELEADKRGTLPICRKQGEAAVSLVKEKAAALFFSGLGRAGRGEHPFSFCEKATEEVLESREVKSGDSEKIDSESKKQAESSKARDFKKQALESKTLKIQEVKTKDSKATDLESKKTNNENSKLDSKGVDYHAYKPTHNNEKTESYPHANIESTIDSESKNQAESSKARDSKKQALESKQLESDTNSASTPTHSTKKAHSPHTAPKDNK